MRQIDYTKSLGPNNIRKLISGLILVTYLLMSATIISFFVFRSGQKEATYASIGSGIWGLVLLGMHKMIHR